MPRVCINKKQFKQDNIASWVVGQLFKKRLKKKDLADALDMSRQGLDWKLHNNSFDYGDLLTIFEFLDSTDDEILQVMRLKEA